MGTVDGCSLYAVAMVDLTVTSFLVYLKLKGREGGRGGEGRERERERERGREGGGREGERERGREQEREGGRGGRRERERIILKYMYRSVQHTTDRYCKMIRQQSYFVDAFTYMWQIVVEVSIASTEVTPQQCGMSGEDGRHRKLLQSTDEHSQTT